MNLRNFSFHDLISLINILRHHWLIFTTRESIFDHSHWSLFTSFCHHRLIATFAWHFLHISIRTDVILMPTESIPYQTHDVYQSMALQIKCHASHDRHQGTLRISWSSSHSRCIIVRSWDEESESKHQRFLQYCLYSSLISQKIHLLKHSQWRVFLNSQKKSRKKYHLKRLQEKDELHKLEIQHQ